MVVASRNCRDVARVTRKIAWCCLDARGQRADLSPTVVSPTFHSAGIRKSARIVVRKREFRDDGGLNCEGC